MRRDFEVLGRRFLADEALLRVEVLRRAWLPDDRERERPAVLVLRDLGGEDVRVAMVANVRDDHICHTCHTPIRRLSLEEPG